MRRFIQQGGFVAFHRYLFNIRSFSRKCYYRLLGMKIGSRTTLDSIRVVWPHQVDIGRNCILEHDIYLKFDGVWKEGPSIHIEDDTFIGCNSEFNITKEIKVGRNCLIASGCRFIDHDHGFEDRKIPMNQSGTGKEAPIQIEEDVWIGSNSVILKGVTVGKGAIVGAGAVVNRSVPDYEIWGGVPARKIDIRD